MNYIPNLNTKSKPIMETITLPTVIYPKDVEAQVFGALTVRRFLNTPAFPNMSVSEVTINGENEPAYNEDFDSVYIVKCGTGVFEINGEVWPVQEGSVVVIPRGVHYQDYGYFTAFAISSPPWHPPDTGNAFAGMTPASGGGYARAIADGQA